MSKVTLTVSQIINLGLLEKVCDYKGWDYYIFNEGIIDENELVEFDDELKKEEEIIKPKYIEDLAGETITQIRPIYNDFGAYIIEIYLKSGVILRIEREHSEDHYLEWNIETI